MDREIILRDLDDQITNLARLHILHGLHETEAFDDHRQRIQRFIRENGIDVRAELNPMSLNLYRRYFG